MEKESQPDSMATINMKPEYAPSETYSASEPPPAYRQRTSSSVQIARIVALTVVASSFILGSFILASSWVQARASCHQLEQLDAMLDKELALESRAYGNDGLIAEELPIANAHALHGAPPSQEPAQSLTTEKNHPAPVAASQVKDDGLNHAESKIDEDKLQKLDGESPKKTNFDADDSSESDSSSEDEDELEAMRPLFKLPLQFDLDEIAGAFLANNQKGRMNCVVEKRHEEPMEKRFPFNLLGSFAPRSGPASAERIAIICHGGDEPRGMESFPEPQSQVFAFPLSGPVRLPVRPQPDRAPMRLPFPDFARPQGSPFNIPMMWDSSEEQQGVNAGVPPREMRIHVQRVIAVPAPHNMPPADHMNPFSPPPAPVQQQEQNEQSNVVHQFVPQPAPTQDIEQPEVQRMQIDGAPMQMGLPWGLTPEDLQMIHRTAEDAAASQRREQQIDNDMQEVKTIVNTLVTAAAEAQAHEDPEPATQAQPVNAARAPRTLMLPHDSSMDGRPHYVQPRSVRTARSVDAMLGSEQRVKRCSCACK